MRRYFGAAVAASLLCALSMPAKAVTLTAANIGDSGVTALNGLVGGNLVPGLTGTMGLTFLSITGGGTSWNFSYIIDNTSSGGITSELSGFGLNTTPNVTGASATGLYANTFLNVQFSSGTQVDFCASAGASCPGGSSNGISASDPAATGLFSLIVSPAVNSLSLDAAFVRYQAITGTNYGNSGIGTNSNVVITPQVSAVPIPAVGAGLPGLIAGLFGLVALQKRRRQRNALMMNA